MAAWLAAELKGECKVSTDVWKFNFLALPQFWKWAARDAAAADLIIISCRGDVPLPAHMKSWITEWLPEKTSDQAALLALLDQDGNAPACGQPLYAYLRRAAAEGRMDFFCKAGDWKRQRFEYTVETRPHDFQRHSPVVEGILKGKLDATFPWIHPVEFLFRPVPGRVWRQEPDRAGVTIHSPRKRGESTTEGRATRRKPPTTNNHGNVHTKTQGIWRHNHRASRARTLAAGGLAAGPLH